MHHQSNNKEAIYDRHAHSPALISLYPFRQALGTLPGEKLAGVLNIVAEGKSALGMNGNGDELELDIDQLDDDTLLKLEKYTTGVLAVRPQTLGSMASSDLPSILRAPKWIEMVLGTWRRSTNGAEPCC